MIRTVGDLIRELNDLDNPDAPIRIASVGHRTAFAYTISAVAESYDNDFTVYLAEGAQDGYLPGDVRDQI